MGARYVPLPAANSDALRGLVRDGAGVGGRRDAMTAVHSAHHGAGARDAGARVRAFGGVRGAVLVAGHRGDLRARAQCQHARCRAGAGARPLGALGVWLLLRMRDDVSPRGARLSFLGGAFLWSLVQVAFYGGWVVGPESLAVYVPVQPVSFALCHAGRARDALVPAAHAGRAGGELRGHAQAREPHRAGGDCCSSTPRTSWPA